jgi:hypothetical protein
MVVGGQIDDPAGQQNPQSTKDFLVILQQNAFSKLPNLSKAATLRQYKRWAEEVEAFLEELELADVLNKIDQVGAIFEKDSSERSSDDKAMIRCNKQALSLIRCKLSAELDSYLEALDPQDCLPVAGTWWARIKDHVGEERGLADIVKLARDHSVIQYGSMSSTDYVDLKFATMKTLKKKIDDEFLKRLARDANPVISDKVQEIIRATTDKDGIKKAMKTAENELKDRGRWEPNPITLEQSQSEAKQ